MNSHYHIIIYLIFSVHLGRLVADTKGFSLELIHRDSLDPPGNLSDTERLDRLLETSLTVGSDDLNIRPAVKCEYYLYLVNVRVGPKEVWLGLDTGRSLVWTQSEPCNSCFPHENNYRPDESPTFRRLLTNNPLCYGSYVNCAYEKRYQSGGIYTKGVLATDDFSFASRDGTETFPLVFGASNNNSVNFFGNKRLVSGIFGMGIGHVSFLEQVGDRIDGRYSYCLIPPDTRGPNSYLRFGNDIATVGNYQRTKIVKLTGVPFYFVSLEGVSVDRKRLNLPKGTFAPPARAGDPGGCVFNTGSPMINMIAPAYDTIKTALVKYFARFRQLEPFTYRTFDICYRRHASFDSFPSVDLHFKAGYLRTAKLSLSRDQLFYTFAMGTQFCVTMVRSNRITMVGVVALQNTHVVYDTRKGRVYFAPKNCTQING